MLGYFRKPTIAVEQFVNHQSIIMLIEGLSIVWPQTVKQWSATKSITILIRFSIQLRKS
jgi:hypothetical protein